MGRATLPLWWFVAFAVATACPCPRAYARSVQYAAAGNLTPDEGSLELEFVARTELAPVPQPYAKLARLFALELRKRFGLELNVMSRDGQLRVGAQLVDRSGANQLLPLFGELAAPIAEGAHRVALTWQGRAMALYFDGELVSQRLQGAGFMGWPVDEQFAVGDPREPAPVEVTALRLSSVARTPEELGAAIGDEDAFTLFHSITRAPSDVSAAAAPAPPATSPSSVPESGRSTMLLVSPLPIAPTLDGVIAKREWYTAGQVSVGTPTRDTCGPLHPIALWVARTPHALHLAARIAQSDVETLPHGQRTIQPRLSVSLRTPGEATRRVGLPLSTSRANGRAVTRPPGEVMAELTLGVMNANLAGSELELRVAGDRAGCDRRALFTLAESAAPQLAVHAHARDVGGGTMQAELEVVNHGPPTSVEATVAVRQAGAPPDATPRYVTRALTIPTGRRRALSTRLTATGEQVVSYEVRTAAGVVSRGDQWLLVEPQVDVQLTPYWLKRERIDLRIDTARDAPAGSLVTFELLRRDGKVLPGVRSAHVALEDGTASASVSTKGLAAGSYRVRVRATDAHGQRLFEVQKSITKPTIPSWFRAAPAPSSRPPPAPFEPVHATPQGVVTVWNRVYDLGEGLPRSIAVAGAEILSAPVRLTLQRHGESQTFRANKVRLERASPRAATYRVTMNAGEVSLTGTARIEFDGLVWYDLILSSASGADVDGLTLTAELPRSTAELLSAHNGWIGGRDGAQLRATPGVAGVLTTRSLPFSPSVWIGNERAGLIWVAEAPLSFHNRDPSRVIDVTRNETGEEPARLAVHIIDQPTQVRGPTRLSFGLEATPIRARPRPDVTHVAQLAGPSADEGLYARLAEAGAKVLVLHSGWKGDKEHDWGGFPSEPRNAAQRVALRRAVRLAHAAGLKVLVYTGWGVLRDTETWWNFRHELTAQPTEFSGWNTERESKVRTGAYLEFAAYHIAQLLSRYGFDGVFWDSTSNLRPTRDEEFESTAETPRPEEAVGFPVLGTRALFARVYELIHGELLRDGVVVNFGGSVWSINAFSDVFHRGEGDVMTAHTLREAWGDDLALFRANYSGLPFGLAYVGVSKDARQLPLRTAHQQAVSLLFGACSKLVGEDLATPAAQAVSSAWRAQSWLPFDAKTEWLGGAPNVSATPAELRTALFVARAPARGLLVVSNLSSHPIVGATVRLDVEHLGLGAISHADDAANGSVLPFRSDGTAELDLEPQSYRLVRVRFAGAGSDESE